VLVGEENIHRLASLQQREDVKRRVFGEVGRVSLPFATDFIAATAKNSEAEQQGRTAVALRAVYDLSVLFDCVERTAVAKGP